MMTDENIQYLKAEKDEGVTIFRRITLENGVILYVGPTFAEGSDGRIYHAVLREIVSPDGSVCEEAEILGWTAETEDEVTLR